VTRTRLQRVRSVILKILLCVSLAAGAFLGLTPPGRYLARAGWAEAKILAGRQPIDRLVADSTVPAATRAKLRLVLDARAYAVQRLGLEARESFTTFTQLDSDTLVLVLSVAHRDQLALRTWWWPIVGRVPYQGFFDLRAAERAQARFERDGFDTELRPAAAFSTLGWFNDPLLSTTLEGDSASLVNTVIHELVHNTIWIPGDAGFNESFASFVGREGATAFFTERGDTATVARLARARPFEQALGRFYAELYAELDSAFRAHPGDAQRDRRLAVRDTVFGRARGRLATEIVPRFGIRDSTWAARVRLNNATVLARRVYREDAGEFEAILAQSGGDLRNAIARIGDIALNAPRGQAMDALRQQVAR
jgi:predicted aminopeptidase